MGKYSMTTRGKRLYDWDVDFSFGSSWDDKYSGMTHPGDVLWDKAAAHFPWDWNSYESMLEWSSTFGIGRIFQARADQLEYEENKRWLEDYAKNTGIDLKNTKYPIRAGFYRGYTSPYAPAISATESILSLYGSGNLLRWL